jgi:hypothetical protein
VLFAIQVLVAVLRERGVPGIFERRIFSYDLTPEKSWTSKPCDLWKRGFNLVNLRMDAVDLGPKTPPLYNYKWTPKHFILGRMAKVKVYVKCTSNSSTFTAGATLIIIIL